MTLFKEVTETVEKEVLNAESAQAIYAEFKLGKNENELFKEGVSFSDSKLVMDEIKVLESEMLSKMNGSFVLTEMVPAEYNEEGEETAVSIPATYYNVTTELVLKNSMSSDLLDVSILVADVRAYYTKDIKLSWVNFVNLFKSN